MVYVGNILYDDELKCTGNKLVIFGAGVYGRKVLRYLELNDLKKNVVCFCDSNEKINKTEINGISVYQTKEVIKRNPEADYLISGRYTKEMYHILRKEGIKKIHILIS